MAGDNAVRSLLEKMTQCASNAYLGILERLVQRIDLIFYNNSLRTFFPMNQHTHADMPKALKRAEKKSIWLFIKCLLMNLDLIF